jgi:hypothetical protein
MTSRFDKFYHSYLVSESPSNELLELLRGEQEELNRLKLTPPEALSIIYDAILSAASSIKRNYAQFEHTNLEDFLTSIILHDVSLKYNLTSRGINYKLSTVAFLNDFFHNFRLEFDPIEIMVYKKLKDSGVNIDQIFSAVDITNL